MFGFQKKNNQERTEVFFSNRTILRVLLLVVISFLLLAALKKTSHALILILIAFFLTLALNAPVHWLSEHLPGKSRSLATTISFILVVLIIVGLLASFIPSLVRDTSNFINAAPQLINNVGSQDSSLGKFIRRYHLENQTTNFANQLGGSLQNLTATGFSTITRITSSIFSVLAIFALTFMMLIEGPEWITVIRKIIPQEHREQTEKLASDMYGVVRGYVNGQVILALIAAVLIVVPLIILNVSYPAALMVIVFISALIPLIGHPIGALILTTVALFHSPWAALIILVYYVFYIQIENYIIQPHIQANSTDMSPLLVFSSVVIGVSLDGLVGGLLAIPIAGCIRILVVDYIRNHRLMKSWELDKVKEDTK